MSSLIKIQAPQPKPYDGKRDALLINTFLNSLRTYFKLARLPEDDDAYKITLAEGYLTGDASYWWSLVPEDKRPEKYAGFEQLLKAQFYPADATIRAKQQLARAVQRTSVAAYTSYFNKCLIQVGEISESEKFDRFVEGLKPEVKKYIYIQDVQCFEEAQALALKIEGAEIASHGLTRESRGPERPIPTSSGTRSGRKYQPQIQELRTGKYFNIVCNYCGKKGHTQRVCWENPNRDPIVSKSNPPKVQQLKGERQ
uniref:Ty3 transposon capsid-like protein domain-containing protein n=1 Tax=Rhodosorus marinus TaxID=101924 RepID=A0A7S3A6S2_9RHOD|mmetsp:Transcript_45752/g.178076  ORF Transcript_45752/g.178076 Transcript_45752/m.178076 type:complete len:255 (+) Transcript_45752:381-1145(+)